MKLDIKSNGNGTITEVTIDGVKGEQVSLDLCCRQVFICGDKIIKFDSSPESDSYNPKDRTDRQTTAELRVLRKIENKDKEHFVLPLKTGKHKGLAYTVQPFVKPTGKGTIEKLDLLNRITQKYDLCDVYFWEGTALCKNFVFTQTGVKIYDYADV